MKELKPLNQSQFDLKPLKTPRKICKQTENVQNDYDLFVFKTPKKIVLKTKNVRAMRKAKQNIVGSQLNKCVIFCPEEEVKHYAEIVKNSQMSPVAVKPKNQSKKQKKSHSVVLLIFIGLLIGFLNGFFGGGGGMLCVPLLMYAFKMEDKKSHATALLVMLPISIVSFCVYLSNFQLDLDLTLFVLGGSVLGGLVGSILLKKMSNQWIRLVFAIVMIVAGIKILL